MAMFLKWDILPAKIYSTDHADDKRQLGWEFNNIVIWFESAIWSLGDNFEIQKSFTNVK